MSAPVTIELRICKTCAHSMTGPRAGFVQYDNTREQFETLKEARAWLRDEYGTAKRRPIYRDNPGIGQGARKVGYVIGFRCKYRSPGDAIMEQHWIEFTEVKSCAL